MQKCDSKVHHSDNPPSSTCRWKAFHQFVLGRKLLKPAVLSSTNFPDSGEICMCQSRLYLRSSEVGEKDISRALCELLGLELNVYIFIELDGFSRKGGTRLVSLLTSLLKLFDQRVSVIFISEDKVDFKLVDKFIEKEYSYDQISNKKVRKFTGEVSQKEEVVKSSQKDSLEIDELKQKVTDLERKARDDQATFKLSLGELNEKVSQLENVESHLTRENNALVKSLADKSEAAKIKELEAEVQELRLKNRETADSANEHLEERNLRLKQLGEEEEKVKHLRSALHDKDRKVEELSRDLKVQITGSKHVEEELNREISKNEHLQQAKKKVEELLEKSVEESAQKGQDLDEKQIKVISLESAVRTLGGKSRILSVNIDKMDEDNKVIVKIIREKMMKNQQLFPCAGSSEIIHRSISSFKCDMKYTVIASGLCECTVSVVRGVVAQISSLATFKGNGTSKQKSKQKAFDDYLSLLLNH